MNFRDFLGGHPLAVVIRLAILSILVGVVLSIFGVTPRNFFQVLDGFARFVYDLGFGAVEWILEYLALGAMIVVPVWLLIRLLKSGDNSASKTD
ncbi:MAG: DUF6460 domain-containing protein [Hyphomicrobium sp.]